MHQMTGGIHQWWPCDLPTAGTLFAFTAARDNHAGMKAITTAALVMALLLSGCITRADQQVEAQQMVHQLYTALQQQDWDTALSLYGKQFYSGGMSRKMWRKRLIHLQQTLGPMKDRSLIFSQHDPRFRYDAYIFSYHVHYAKGSTKDIITIYNPVDGNQLHIVGHKITESAT